MNMCHSEGSRNPRQIGTEACEDDDVTVVLVHGNPETDAVWGPLVDALGRKDVVRLSPPGFGAPLPLAFPATYIAYRDWLVDELQRIDEPVDLVGHDWGGLHVLNAVMHEPELVRSWASDVVGMFDPDYLWHDMAQIFQTPEAGEQIVDAMIAGSLEDRAQQEVDLRHSRRRCHFVRRSAGSGDGSGDPGAIPIGAPTGSRRCGTRARERCRPAGTVAAGHRGPLRRHRRDAASGG